MYDDLKLIIQIYIIHSNSDEYNWRYSIIYTAHIFPAVALFIEMSMNKLRIPLHHIIYNLLIVGFYIFVTWSYQVTNKYEAIFYHSLNWKCKFDWSFLYLKDDLRIPRNSVKPIGCKDRETSTHLCQPIYPYVCLSNSVHGENEEMLPIYDNWKNRYLFLSTLILVSFVSFIMFWFVHKWKAGFHTQGFNKRKWVKRIKDGWFQNNEIIIESNGTNQIGGTIEFD